jgi:hypothetical protein
VEEDRHTDEQTMLGDIRHRIMKHAAEAILNAQSGRRTRKQTQRGPETYRVARYSEAAEPLLADPRGGSEETVRWETA